MNEDERGITPPDVTAMALEPAADGWRVTIEQGNGMVIKELDLTEMERAQLAMMLSGPPGITLVEFVDFTR